ncbi:MAG: vitamin B12-dependent ribonucleotide reductase [Actinomycetota bacterium]|nr:vitamin B12-dependent ribonucleotide reductase [Actinomycetota bacterium]
MATTSIVSTNARDAALEALDEVFSDFTWEERHVVITRSDGSVAFSQEGVVVPKDWGANATQVLAQKYFRGNPGAFGRETSLKEVVTRIVTAIAEAGETHGHLADETEVEEFSSKLGRLLVAQRAAFNSPVWFNVGAPGRKPQVAACFILDVEDSMDSILDWYKAEGLVFKGGSGAGVNLSKIRSQAETLSTGGNASGPVSFMRGADASAGTIKSGGATRRAAKMVVLDVDHPDVLEFVWCKAKEERKIRALMDAGFDMGVDGADSFSVAYQNANNSVRLGDDFMQAVVADGDWQLRARVSGEVVRALKARDLFDQIARAAWECADPGVQFSTTINSWNTTPRSGEIRASNPCSEHVRLDWSSCNLSSLNLLAFYDPVGGFDAEGFVDAVGVMALAQDILIDLAYEGGGYPLERIAETTRRFRDIGVGYANLGALLMAMGLPYDSDEGRDMAAALSALMTAAVYRTSAQAAARLGPFEAFEENREAFLFVLERHRSAAKEREVQASSPRAALWRRACAEWDAACAAAAAHGVRNAEATVLAPTGTIALLMGCETTGIEPAFALVSYKQLVGGGAMSLPVESVALGLAALGYDRADVEAIAAYAAEHGTLTGAPGLDPAHRRVFETAVGDDPIPPMGHVKMVAAVQPFLSGAVSKTVNLPADASVADIADIYLEAWRLGVKCLAVYRDGCKAYQPLSAKADGAKGAEGVSSELEAHPRPERERLPRHRRARTFSFRIGDCEGYATVGEYDDGRPGELFMKVSKQGSTLAGLMDGCAIAVSLGLQYGVPLATYVAKYTSMRFEPAGVTDDPDVRLATSILDFVFRRLAITYLDEDERRELGVLTAAEKTQALDAPYGSVAADTPPAAPAGTNGNGRAAYGDAPVCPVDGSVMTIRTGTCWACALCGTSGGC